MNSVLSTVEQTAPRPAPRPARCDEQALSQAFTSLRPRLVAYVARLVGPTDAEDVVQRTFLDAWRRSEGIDPTEPRFASWLFTIAHHRAVDTLRARTRAVITVELHDEAGDDGRDALERYAEADLLRTALADLPDHERTAVVLRHLDQLTQQEIATRLGVPIGTVKARIARGTRRLGVLVTQRARSVQENTTGEDMS